MDSSHFLVRHGEKLVTGSFGCWLVYTLVAPFALRPAALDQRDQLARGVAEVETTLSNLEVSLEPTRNAVPALRRELDPIAVPTVDPFAGWLWHRRPSFLFTCPPPVEPLRCVHARPALEVGKVERHHVELAWGPDTAKNAYVKVTGYELYRKDAPTADWRSIGTFAADQRRTTDATVGAHALVAYRIVERVVADDDAPEAHGRLAPLEPAAVEADQEVPAFETPRDFFVEVLSGTPEVPGGARAKATLKVWAWHASGRFVAKEYRDVLADASIGALEPKFRLDRTKAEPVDFTTGATLVDVRIEKRPLPRSNVTVNRAVAVVRWPWGEETVVEGEAPAGLGR